MKGAATVYFLLFTMVISGLLVMATDFGRMYVIQGELQTAADSVALAAALRLVGTANSVMRAGDQVSSAIDSTTGNDNRFNLRMNQVGSGGTGLVTSMAVDYFSALSDALANSNGGQSGGLDWASGTYPKYVRVEVSAEAPVLFVPLLNRGITSLPTIAVASVAGISGPLCAATGIEGLAVVDRSAGADDPNFGFVPGEFYTLYLTTLQQSPNAPVTPAPQAGTVTSVPYAILNHVPAGPMDLDLDATLFEIGAGGISTAPNLTPPATITIETPESAYPNLAGNTTAGTSVGRNVICGLNTRFGADPSSNLCGTIVGGEFVNLSPEFRSDTDAGTGTYAADAGLASTGLQDFAAEYDGNLRRVLTMAVVDAADTLNVVNFRQFLIEMSPGQTQGLNPAGAAGNAGVFRAQYLGVPVPIRSGGGGACRVSLGVGRVVLH